MQLSEENRNKILEWIKEKCGVLRCVCCGNAKWQLGQSSTLSIGFDLESTRFFYAQGIPQISIVCEHCGHIVNFSPAVMGIKPKGPESHNVEK
ncbi:MAG: hypothetical protein PVI75_04780 [Gammaproteobacteria bacterium]|jgi:hypothetical protein